MRNVALITGSSRGIGKAICKKLASDGYDVVITYKKSKQQAILLEEEIKNYGIQTLLVKVDLSNAKDCKMLVEKTIKKYGHIDVLVNNAGICSDELLIDESIENINNVVNTNLISTILTTKFALPYIFKNPMGRIVNIASIVGTNGCSNESVYSATKGGIIAFTKSLAKEVGSSGITVNCISPGFIKTDMTSNYSADELEEIKSRIALNQLGTPADIAETVAFLVSDGAKYITGQNIGVDGGFLI